MNVPSSLLSLLSCAFISIGAHSTSFATTVSLEVPSTASWFDTGIDVFSGQLLQIDASGTVRFDTTSIAGADPNGVGPGWDGTQTVLGDPLPTAIHLSLIGRIGEVALPEGAPGGGLGFVGSSYSELTALTGRLYLGFNDDYYVDNSGAFSVTVRTTTPVPDAGDTMALLCLGVGALGFAHRKWSSSVERHCSIDAALSR